MIGYFKVKSSMKKDWLKELKKIKEDKHDKRSQEERDSNAQELMRAYVSALSSAHKEHEAGKSKHGHAAHAKAYAEIVTKKKKKGLREGLDIDTLYNIIQS